MPDRRFRRYRGKDFVERISEGFAVLVHGWQDIVAVETGFLV